jgi:outer membrane PBP1 activator LpoA protein
VNISPFAETIDLYASSRSYGQMTVDSDKRDLTGLTFTEMPWLLPSKVNRQLKVQSQKLWPERESNLQRLYAMGLDSLKLLPKLEKMQALPIIRHFGQTGVLQLDSDNIIKRTLSWARYRKQTIVQVNLD